MSARCTNCGASFGDGEPFCSYCGGSLSASAALRLETPPTTATSTAKTPVARPVAGTTPAHGSRSRSLTQIVLFGVVATVIIALSAYALGYRVVWSAKASAIGANWLRAKEAYNLTVICPTKLLTSDTVLKCDVLNVGTDNLRGTLVMGLDEDKNVYVLRVE